MMHIPKPILFLFSLSLLISACGHPAATQATVRYKPGVNNRIEARYEPPFYTATHTATLPVDTPEPTQTPVPTQTASATSLPTGTATATTSPTATLAPSATPVPTYVNLRGEVSVEQASCRYG
ncbi:MAG: hypothetical protein ACM3PY_16905, partial [Omnitrophica WOR_2 bacterium]